MAKIRLLFCVYCAQLCHVYRIGPQPKLAARDPAARELSRRRQDQEAHHRQPVRLADRDRRRLRTLLKGGKVAPADQESIIVRRALPHGHVAAVLGTLRNISPCRTLGPPRHRCRDLVIATLPAPLTYPTSQLDTARMLHPLPASSSLDEQAR